MDCKVFQAYVVRDHESGKRYIGVTSQGLRKRWNEHLSNARRWAEGDRVNIQRWVSDWQGV